ncbi:MAG: sigma-70 family RNA polymerase sigma factor [Verrucomicrobiota bacterium]
MNDQTDSQLLRAYAEHRAEPAFAELVRRHVDFVYSAAQRMVCDAHLAEDVTQAVFVALAKNAAQLMDRPVLSGWLHRTAQNLAAQTVRTDVRRRAREQEAVAMNELIAGEPEAGWERIAPHLDAALGELSESDRDALLLRYFERKSAQEMAQTLGISDEAAQKRVSRAVERLREFFSKRNVTIGASGLAVLISANAVQAAPIGLAATISATAILAGTAIHTSTVITATKAIAMTTLQKSIIGATLAVAVGAGIFEAHQASQLRVQNELLVQQVAQLQADSESLSNRLAGIGEARKMPDDQFNELLKLRGEVGVLQNEANDPMEKAAKTAVARAKFLKQYMEQHPDRKIPELQFLSEKDWADAAWNADLNTEDGIRVALSNLRGEAENIFLNQMMQTAIKKYLAANNNILPADLSELKSYFAVPVTDEMLQRYTLLQTGTPNSSDSLVKLTSYADDDYDSNHEITLHGASGGGFNRNEDAINDAAREFARANNYQAPTDPSQIAPYLHKTIDPATIQKYLNQFVMDPPSSDEAIMAPVLSAYSTAHNGGHPDKASDLIPYITTPEQKAAFQRLEPDNHDLK